MSATAFDLAGPLPLGRTLIEASAGTGKTFSIAALVARFIAGDTAGPGHDLAEGVGIDEILVVTYTRAAASELRDRIRGTLRDAVDYLDGVGHERGERNPVDGAAADRWMRVFDVGSHRVRHRRSTRLREALARFDEATITTIHGFCQQALAQSGLRSGSDPGVELVEDNSGLVAEVCRDVLIDRLADDPLALSTDGYDSPLSPDSREVRPPSKIERYVIDTVRAVLSNPAARCEPGPDAGGIAGDWAAVVGEIVQQVDERQRVRRQIGYDRLVSDLRNLLADPRGGPQLAEQLASRYRLVLVDEFQDTDRLQWDVFNLAFGRHRLVTVGDPKQAIYRFRGADVHAYLAAVERSVRSTLATNHRSDQQLIDALGVLFNGATLGHDAIAFSRVDAAPGALHNAMAHGRSRGPGADPRSGAAASAASPPADDTAALHIRVVPDDEAIPRTKLGLESGAVQRIVLGNVAARIRTLLDDASITGIDGTARRVEAHDIAVLVPSQRRAAETAAVLRDWGIPSVRARTGSVLDTDAVVQWRLLLAGLATPTRARVARAAGLGWFFDQEPAELTEEHETRTDSFETPLAALQRRLAVLAERLRVHGVGAFYEQLRSESEVLRVVLSRSNGDRDLTDLDHIADLLVAATRGGSTDPARVQQTLDSLIAAGGQAEVMMRRIESDAEAVPITTIHSAKGLEYPIVLVPFAYVERTYVSRPFVYHDADGRRVIDVASWVAWSQDGAEGRPSKQAMEQRKDLARREIDGDGLRLLYVALTRARHRVEVWWAPMKSSASSAFGRLLLDREGAGPVQNSPVGSAFEKLGPDVDATRAQIDAIVTASNGTIAAFGVPVDQPVRRPLPVGGETVDPLQLADASIRGSLADPSWRSWSFTSITKAIIDGDDLSRRLAAGDGSAAPEPTGGHDEPADPVDGAIPQRSRSRQFGPTDHVAMPLADTVGGTTFGVMVHEILEHVDFTSPSLATDIESLAAAGADRAGLALDTGALTAGLVAAIETPLGPLFDRRRLRDISPADRLAELTFDVALGTEDTHRLLARHLGETLRDTLPDGDPIAAYGAQLAEQLDPLALAGWLTGSIDGVFRVGDRFVVVDYKSNRLHEPGATDPLAAYRPALLVGAMVHSHYPFQALLYSVALHRYLGWRLGATYDPERHLGGIAYLFVRGMVGAETPTLDGAPFGVFSWRPPAATILGIDALLRGDGGRSWTC